MFCKTVDIETFVRAWGYMDDLICTTKAQSTISKWKRDGTPRGVRYDDLTTNRYQFEEAFAKDSPERILSVFVKLMAE